MAETQQTSGIATLIWGVKQSFRSYVEAAGGAIELGAGAARDADGAFAFAAAGGDLVIEADGKPAGAGRFTGEVRFEAHGGMLSVLLADPWLEIGPAAASITVAESAARSSRVELAVLDLAAAVTDDGGDIIIPAKLSKDGWRILGDHYLPFTPLDPVRLKLTP
ncbi:MAG TPA: HtaA domain-containing protein [Caulobacteraceae bacterium]|nr:HtaA domain-containing protein [Caulobacteraceae bacterium]